MQCGGPQSGQPLVELVLDQQRFESGQHPLVSADGQLTLRQKFLRPELLLPHIPPEVFTTRAAQLGERIIPPQIDCPGEQINSPIMMMPVNCLPRLGGQSQEPVVIDQLRIHRQPVGAGAGHPHQGILEADQPQGRPQPAGQRVEQRSAGMDGGILPQELHDRLDPHGITGVVEQDSEQAALLRRSQRDRPPPDREFGGTQNRELHQLSPPLDLDRRSPIYS
ncbi:hypothetical protein TK50_02905 [Micromonospora haikouensis]|uniref:Uncharacterized protein n=1 Tax=Micromonospora haikouensis TaxID=686309 RepID=A0A0D0X0C3_9ACTN|nr:hypothetical protein TK50_02905 [Micromonospora haikouensis]